MLVTTFPLSLSFCVCQCDEMNLHNQNKWRQKVTVELIDFTDVLRGWISLLLICSFGDHLKDTTDKKTYFSL